MILHKLNRGSSGELFLIGPRDEELIEKLKALPKRWRRWAPGLGAWRIADEAEEAVRDIVWRHYATPEQLERWRLEQRVAYLEKRVAALRAEKKAALRKDWGIG